MPPPINVIVQGVASEPESSGLMEALTRLVGVEQKNYRYDTGTDPQERGTFDLELSVSKDSWPMFRAEVAFRRTSWEKGAYITTLRDQSNGSFLGFLSPGQERKICESRGRTATSEDGVANIRMTL